MLGKLCNQVLGVNPAAAAQPARIQQVGALAFHVPMDFIAVHCLALVLVLEGVRALAHLHPAHTHTSLGSEGIAAGFVGSALAFRLIELEIECIRSFLAIGLPVGCHTPVLALRHLIALHGQHHGANHVLDGRRNAELLLLAQ